MRFDDFLEAAGSTLQSKFNIEEQSITYNELMQLAPAGLPGKAVFRAQRKPGAESSNMPTWKTLLFCSLSSDGALTLAFEWAAHAKEFLVDPETADLYLFICFEDGCQLSQERCLRIESTEQFCRKYVLQENETFKDFFNRTFLAESTKGTLQNIVADPVISAFAAVAKGHTWFSSQLQAKWRAALLSGMSASDIIDELFNTDPA